MKFDAVSGQSYTLYTSNLSSSMDTYLYLYDLDGTTLIASDDDSGPGLASRIDWVAPDTGTYYLMVRHYSDGYGIGTYDMQVGPPPPDIEPPYITWTDPWWGGYVSSTVTVYFSEPLDPASVTSETVRLEKDGIPVPINIIYNPGEFQLQFSPTNGWDESAYYWATIGAGLTDTSGNPMGYDYAWGFYTYYSDSFEDDDAYDQAEPIAVGGETHGHTIYPAGDHDWMSFTAQVGETYTVETLSLTDNPWMDTYLYLYDRDGSTLLASNDNGGSSVASKIVWAAPTDGTYYLMVSHASDGYGIGGYAIRVSGEPRIGFSPDRLDFTVEEESSASLPLTIENFGLGALQFRISEATATGELAKTESGITWLSKQDKSVDQVGSEVAVNRQSNIESANANQPASYIYNSGLSTTANILVYTDDAYESPGATYVERALQNLGYSYTAYYADYYGFQTALNGGYWDLVLVSHNTYFQFGQLWPDLENYYNNGGKLVIETFDIDGSNSLPTTLWATLGINYFSDNWTPLNVYRWDESHPIFNQPQTIGDFTSWTEGYWDDGDKVDPSVFSAAVAGFDLSSSIGNGGIVVSDEGRAVTNSFVISEDRADLDGDGVLDAVELWENEVEYVLGPKVDVPWLSETPTGGVVGVGSQTTVAVTADAKGLARGSYAASLIIKSNDPVRDTITIPVNLTIVPQDAVPPVTTMDLDPPLPNGQNNWYKTAPLVTLTPDESATTYYSWDTTPSTIYTGPFAAPEGEHALYYYSVDAAGNTEAIKSSSLIKVDTILPQAGITQPENGSHLKGVVSVLGSADDTNFGFYALEYGAGESPVSWAVIAESTAAVSGGNLGNWDHYRPVKLFKVA